MIGIPTDVSDPDSVEMTPVMWPRLQAEGTIARVMGKRGGQFVAAEYFDALPADFLDPGMTASAEVVGFPVAVANVDGEYYAFQNLCPHQGTKLGGRKLDEGCFITCPMHTSRGRGPGGLWRLRKRCRAGGRPRRSRCAAGGPG